MYPIYSYVNPATFRLSEDDRRGIQKLYGKFMMRFDFQDKTYWGTGFTTLPDWKGLIILPKRKKENKLGKNTVPYSPSTMFFLQRVPTATKRWRSSSAAAWCTAFLHTYILPNTSLLCKWVVSVSEATGREMRDTVPLTKSVGQFSEGRNYSAVGLEHNQNWPHRINFARFDFL